MGASTSISRQIDTSGFMTQLSDDTTPVLGGKLDGGGFDIEDVKDIQLNGQIFEDAMDVYSPAVSPLTIDWANGMIQKIDLENMGGDLTLAFANPQPTSYTLIIKQATGGGIDIVWPAEVNWKDDTPPVITATADAIDIIGMLYDDDAAKYQCSFIQNQQ